MVRRDPAHGSIPPTAAGGRPLRHSASVLPANPACLSPILHLAWMVFRSCPDGQADEWGALAHMIVNRGGCRPSGMGPSGMEQPGMGPFSNRRSDRSDALKTADHLPAKVFTIAWSVAHRRQPDPTGGAVRCHDHRCSPGWADETVATALIGRYLFYL